MQKNNRIDCPNFFLNFLNDDCLKVKLLNLKEIEFKVRIAYRVCCGWILLCKEWVSGPDCECGGISVMNRLATEIILMLVNRLLFLNLK